MNSHGPRTRLVATTLLVALAASGCRRMEVVPCAAPPAVAAPGSRGDAVTLRIDYAGAEAMLGALERDTLSDAAVDSLLNVHGVRMTVDNVTRFIPELGRDDFRTAVQTFVRTGRVADEHANFDLGKVRSERGRIRALVGYLRENEGAVLQRTLATLAPYSPETGPLHLTAYLVAGGVSTGFVPDAAGESAFYANLARADGDCEGVLGNIAHETYHLVQKAALRRVPGLAAVADSVESLPAPERLLATVLTEGTADLVTDPRRAPGDGPAIARERAERRRDDEPARVRANFALFDTLYQQVGRDEITWRALYDRGFADEAPFYAVGRQMAQAIERHCGAACIGRLFERQPVEFFREYVRLYRARPQILGRFAPATERLLGADP
jgi:hypothetical protein